MWPTQPRTSRSDSNCGTRRRQARPDHLLELIGFEVEIVAATGSPPPGAAQT